MTDWREEFENHGIRRVKLGLFDIDGLLRGKHISTDKFFSVLDGGTSFCDVVFGWDIADALYDNVKYTGWHTGYPDAAAQIDIATFRTIPWEPGSAFFLLDFADRDGKWLDVAPRSVLRKVVAEAGSRGYSAICASEYEFWVFKETPWSAKDKNYRGLQTLSPGMFGYSVLRASQNSPFVLDVLQQLPEFRLPLEGFHTETGPGVYEAAIAAAPAIEAADRGALFKTAMKEIASRHGLMATFMAKWNADLPGSGGHLHQSLWDRDGKVNAFTDAEIKGRYIAGLVKYLPELAAMICPTINSYKRTVPGTWAPVNATWGDDNRTTAVRSIAGSDKASRIELRLAGADINPYLAIAASLAAGLQGIEDGEPAPAVTTNAYEASNAPRLPRSLKEAAERFEQSAMARRWFGDAFVEHFTATRDWEVRQFDRAVTDWELSRYFEAI